MRIVTLLPYLALVVGGGLVIGYLTAPDSWYADLAKPGFTPPGSLFAPAWTLLYVLIAIAGWRVSRSERSDFAMTLWWIQLILNFAWSPVFFGAHRIGLALVVIVALLGAIVAFIVAAWRWDRVAAGLFVPYAAWVTFATVLNGFILALNGP
jgi:benzodiazapine receptor